MGLARNKSVVGGELGVSRVLVGVTWRLLGGELGVSWGLVGGWFAFCYVCPSSVPLTPGEHRGAGDLVEVAQLGDSGLFDAARPASVWELLQGVRGLGGWGWGGGGVGGVGVGWRGG